MKNLNAIIYEMQCELTAIIEEAIDAAEREMADTERG